MANPKFDYPNASSPSVSYTFDWAQFYPWEPVDRPHQIIGRTLTGKIKVTDLHSYRRVFRLKWRALSSGKLSDLQSFIRSTVEFAKNSFDFTDSDGNVFTVRITDPEITYSRVGESVWEGELTLEEEIT